MVPVDNVVDIYIYNKQICWVYRFPMPASMISFIHVFGFNL